jgi:hypothetical protein
MFVLVYAQKCFMQNVSYVCFCDLHTEFYILNCDGSLVIAIGRKAKYSFRATTRLLLAFYKQIQ